MAFLQQNNNLPFPIDIGNEFGNWKSADSVSLPCFQSVTVRIQQDLVNGNWMLHQTNVYGMPEESTTLPNGTEWKDIFLLTKLMINKVVPVVPGLHINISLAFGSDPVHEEENVPGSKKRRVVIVYQNDDQFVQEALQFINQNADHFGNDVNNSLSHLSCIK